jgi:transposase
MGPEEFYKTILGVVKPWYISKIELDEPKAAVHVYLEYAEESEGTCPVCGEIGKLYDSREERIWRHLDSCEYQTYLHCKIPRVICKEHKIKTMNIPWSEPQSHFTRCFESYAVEVLQQTLNRSGTAKLLKLSWDEINGIMGRAVKRGLQRRENEVVEYLGVDEKSFRRGQSYVQILTDTKGKRVLEVVENRDEKAVKKVYESLTEEQKTGVKAISMDFWQPYIKGAKEHIAQADIVHDKFHIAKYMGDAVDSVRRSEHKQFKAKGKEILTGAKYLYLKNPENMTDKQRTTFAELTKKQLDVNRAWQRKELLKQFWDCIDETTARSFFKSWYFSATHSRLKPVIKVAKMLKKHFENIITYWKHFISNSFAEGINSKIQLIKSTARGFRNFQNYRTAILFYCGGLDLTLAPQETL